MGSFTLRLSTATVIAAIALFIALGSNSYGAVTKLLPKNKNALIVAYCGGPTCGAYAKAAQAAKDLLKSKVSELERCALTKRTGRVEAFRLLHEIDVLGAVVSTWICCELTCSALPAVSVEKNSTIAEAGTVNGPVYTVLDVVGSDPSVV